MSKVEYDLLERSGYLPQLRKIASSCCAPFWWHGQERHGQYRIYHNATVCFLNTGKKIIGITADHVYNEYLNDKKRNASIACQFGSHTIDPENRLIDRNDWLDIATFELSEIIQSATGASAHFPPHWPPMLLQEGEIVLFGGYPGNLREAKRITAEIPFQSFATAAASVSEISMTLHLDWPKMYWPLHQGEAINTNLGGISGGPVFRIIEKPILARWELVGFIFEYAQSFDVMRARHGSIVASDGMIIAPAGMPL